MIPAISDLRRPVPSQIEMERYGALTRRHTRVSVLGLDRLKDFLLYPNLRRAVVFEVPAVLNVIPIHPPIPGLGFPTQTLQVGKSLLP